MNLRLSLLPLSVITAACIALYGVSPAAADSFDRMISPLSNPVNFEDPRINTEIRPLFLHHEIDDDFVTEGGDVQLYALQARFKLTDRFALLATKDGFIDFNPDTGADETGFANIALGGKYAFYQDEPSGTIMTGGLRYEIPMGNTDVFQGEGDGSFNPFFSYGQNMEMVNFLFGTGFRLPLDSEDSTFYDADININVNIDDVFFPTFEVNVVHVLDGGERLPIADEGQDLFNFGSTDATGKTLVTAAAGFRVRLSEAVDVGAFYQIPLSSGRGSNVIDWRVGTDLIYSFDI